MLLVIFLVYVSIAIVMSLIILDDETPILKGMIIVLIISAVLSVSVFFIATVLAIVITVLFSFIF